jgi:hypothetical protein
MEKLLISTPSHLINTARLEINLDASGDKFASPCLLEKGLESVITIEMLVFLWQGAIRVNAMLKAE